MDKKVYNKPSLKLEIFTPNEYIASCWFVDKNKCYNNVYEDTDQDGKAHASKDNGFIFQNHNNSSHRVPETGYIKSDTNPFVKGTATNLYTHDDNYTLPVNNNYSLNNNNHFTKLLIFYTYSGNHYFSEDSISESNATS